MPKAFNLHFILFTAKEPFKEQPAYKPYRNVIQPYNSLIVMSGLAVIPGTSLEFLKSDTGYKLRQIYYYSIDTSSAQDIFTF